ncbi:MAG TPA: hypothetical protein VL400_01900 [Polyangiaceae bacterium]|jgi:hypothetical protein|nr:hypothetical protein [Polyangiaceae bacterium]
MKTNAAALLVLTALLSSGVARADLVTHEQYVCEEKKAGDACAMQDGRLGRCVEHEDYPKPRARFFCELDAAASATAVVPARREDPNGNPLPEPSASASASASTSPSAAPAALDGAPPASPAPGDAPTGCALDPGSKGGGLGLVVGGVALALVAARGRRRIR